MPIVPVSVRGTTFYGHTTRTIPRKSVNTEAVTIRLDSSWDGLDVVVFWKNSVIEEPVTRQLDDPAQPHTIPWEVLSEIGDLRMGLVGLDGGETVKPTIWLLYGYVVEGVDPDVGSGSQPPTPNYLQQMVEQATAAANAAKEAKKTADNLQAAAAAGEFNGPEGPPGQSPIIQDGNWWLWDVEAQEYRDTGIAASGGGGGGVSSYNDLSDRPKIGGVLLEGNKTAEQLGLATPSQIPNVPSWAMQPQKPAYTAQEVGAQPTGNYALRSEIPTKLPNPYALTINGQVYDGSEAMSVEAVGGGAGGELLLAEYVHQGNQEIHFKSFDWGAGIGECTEPHGLTEAKKVLLVPNEWWTGSDIIGKGITSIPIEWIIYTGANIYVVPTDETHVKITGSDKETIIQVDIGDVSNTLIDATKFHVELPIGFSIKELPVDCTSIRVFAFGITGTLSYRYISLYTNRIYRTRIWPEGFLNPPATGLSKAKYALVFWYDICAEAVPAGAVFVMNNLYKAQRKGYPYWIGDRTSEYLVTNYGIGGDNKAEIFTGLLIENGYACYANHTVFRLYARAVKQE